MCSGCSCDEQQLLVYKKLETIICINFRFFLFFFLIFIEFNFFINSKPTFLLSYFRPWLKSFFFLHRIYCQNFIQIDNVHKCHFQFFVLFWGILTPKIKKNLKLCVRYFFGTSYNSEKNKK